MRRYEDGRMTPAKSREARELLGLSQKQLADMADLSLSTIQDFELGRSIRNSLVESILVTVEAAGVEFIPEKGGRAGVRLRKAGAAPR